LSSEREKVGADELANRRNACWDLLGRPPGHTTGVHRYSFAVGNRVSQPVR
jgi:hypothetical protein